MSPHLGEGWEFLLYKGWLYLVVYVRQKYRELNVCRRCLGKLSSTRGGRPDICTTSLQLGAPPVPALPPRTRLPEVPSPSVDGAGGKPLFLVLVAVFCLFLLLLLYQWASAETCAALCPSAHPECEPLGNSATDTALHCSGPPLPLGAHLQPRFTCTPEACLLLTGWPETLSGPAAQQTSLPFKRLQPNLLQWGEPFQAVLLRGHFLNSRTHSFIFFASLHLFFYIHWIMLSIKLPVFELLCGFCLWIGPTLIMWGRAIMWGNPRH